MKIDRRLFLTSMAGAAVAQTSWTALFDGRTLKGWKPEGKADWSVADGCIVGRQGPDLAGGDLLTEAQFRDFEFASQHRPIAVRGVLEHLAALRILPIGDL